MKRKITLSYMAVFILSVLFLVLFWLILTYVFVLSGRTEDDREPQYLVHRFEQYVENGKISREGKTILSEENLWAQVVDTEGRVLTGYHVPEGVPDAYHIFDITRYTMNSNTLGDQTLFISRFDRSDQYGVIIGCDSSRVSKMSVKFTGGIEETIIKCAFLFLAVFLLTGIGAGIIFSRIFSGPVNDMIETINGLSVNHAGERSGRKPSIFDPVFRSLQLLQIRLKSADREREKAETQRKEWITNISHDMKTPLTTIQGYAELMAEDTYEISEDERKRYSEKIIKNTEVIKNLVEELKFGRLLEDGRIGIYREPVDVCMLLKECCNEIPSEYQAGSITCDFDQEGICAELDRQLMQRCLMNLICNAIIHNDNAVDIVLRCYQTDHTVIQIADNGRGMTAEELEHVFWRYYRGKSSQNTTGSGLGLAIAKEIVTAHKGQLLAESEEGRGSTFTIILP